MRVVIAADDESEMVGVVARRFEERGHVVETLPSGAWGPLAVRVARLVASGAADQGVLLCFTGTGVAMAANKVRGVRAALAVDGVTAAGARRWNDANVLALSLRLLSSAVATEIVDAWLGTVYAGTEDASLAAMAETERAAP
jgi:ribose 5-phosphate isomerase B